MQRLAASRYGCAFCGAASEGLDKTEIMDKAGGFNGSTAVFRESDGGTGLQIQV